MDHELFARLIRNLLNINIFSTPEEMNGLQMFEQKFCFHESLQPMFTAKALTFLENSMKDNIFYEIVDVLDVCLIFFRFDGRTYYAGPYVKKEYDEAKQCSLLARNKLAASYAMPLKLYYTSLPMLSGFRIMNDIGICINAFLSTPTEFGYRRLQGFQESGNEISTHYDPEAVDFDAIYRRYDLENHFIKMVESGNVEAVMEALTEMTSSTNSSNSMFANPLYQNPLASFSIIRILARKAAEKGGLSVITIDEITQKAVQRIAASRNLHEQMTYNQEMVLELTRAVRAERKMVGHCSPPVSSTIEHLFLHFSQNISLEELADRVYLSGSHLSKLFKKETGMTIGQYTAKLRCEYAARLLRDSNLSIQDISCYIGYLDNNYFVKVFKKQFGMTPSAYRAAKKN